MTPKRTLRQVALWAAMAAVLVACATSGRGGPDGGRSAKFGANARILHEAAMSLYVDFSSRPIPPEILDRFAEGKRIPGVALHMLPHSSFPFTARELRGPDGEPLAVRSNEDLAFGGPVMMAYVPPGCSAVECLRDPFSPSGERLRAIVMDRFYAIASVGPDGQRQFSSSIVSDPSQIVVQTYDPTNGANSSGDLFYWGAEAGPRIPNPGSRLFP